MAAAKTLSILVAMMMFAGLFLSISAVTHTVIWNFAANATQYDEWASQQNFVVDDVIAFIFDYPDHSVFEVSKADLDSCNLNNPIKKYETTNASVTLTRSGYFGFICGVPNHCISPGNMKMDVQVLAATSPSPSPSQSPPASPPTAPPQSAPVSPPTVSPPQSAPVSPPTASPPQSAPVSPPTASPPTSSPPTETPSTPPSSSSSPPPPTGRPPAPPPSDASSLQSRSAMVVGALVAVCAAVLL